MRTPLNLRSATLLRCLSIKVCEPPDTLEWVRRLLLNVSSGLELFQLLVGEGGITYERLLDIDETLACSKFERLQSVSVKFTSRIADPPSFANLCAPKLTAKWIAKIYWNDLPLTVTGE